VASGSGERTHGLNGVGVPVSRREHRALPGPPAVDEVAEIRPFDSNSRLDAEVARQRDPAAHPLGRMPVGCQREMSALNPADVGAERPLEPCPKSVWRPPSVAARGIPACWRTRPRCGSICAVPTRRRLGLRSTSHGGQAGRRTRSDDPGAHYDDVYTCRQLQRIGGWQRNASWIPLREVLNERRSDLDRRARGARASLGPTGAL